MFGICVERDTGDAEERSFFGYIAGVRDDSFGFIDQISEEKIILRRHDMKIRGFYAEVFDCIAHISVHGRYDRHTGSFFDHCLHQLPQVLFVVEQYTSVEGEQEIITLLKSQYREPYRFEQPVPVEADGIYQNVADIIYVFTFRACLIQISVGHHAGSKQIIGYSVGNHPVYFLRHLHVEGACAGYQMGYLDSLFLGYDGATHGCCQIVHYQDDVCRILRQLLFEGDHDSGCQTGGVTAFHSKVDIGSFHVEIRKQGSIQTCIVPSACVHQTVGDAFTQPSCGFDGACDRGYFHEIGACPGNNCYFHIVSI